MLESLNGMKFLMAALNLIVLYVVLRKVLFKPVTEFMEKRSKAIQDSIESAERQNAEAAELKRGYEEQIKAAKAERDKIISEAGVRASRESCAIVAEAGRQAESILASARESVEREREQMFREVKGQIAGLALAAATKVLDANMDTENNRRLVEKFLDETGAA